MLARVTGATASGVGRVWMRGVTRLETLVERSHPVLVVGALTLLAGFVWGRYTSQVTDWLVQTDELQFVRSAIEIGDKGLSLHPRLREQEIAAWNQLYPIVLAPLYAVFDTPDAFKAAHWLNAFLMASTAVPVYLLARAVDASKLAGYLVAALSVCVPWMALGDMLRDDAVAYPAFAWGVLAMQRALSEPGPVRDVLALVAIAVAASARTQLLVLAPAFVGAAALHESLSAFAIDRTQAARRMLIARLRQHWVLIAATGLAAIFGLVRGFDTILGAYSSNASGDWIPSGFGHNVAMHVSMVAFAIGVLPTTFAVGWALGSVVRPETRRRHAYACLLLVTGTTVTLAASSFVLRNAGENAFDRYFFYLAPLALVGMAACIEEGRRRWVGAAAAALAFGWIASHGAWTPALPPYHQSPVSAFNSVLDFHAGRLGLTGAEAARWGGMGIALAGAFALRLVPPRVLLPVLCTGLLLFGVAETRSVIRSMGGSQLGVRSQNVGAEYERNWIDATLPDGAGVAMMPEVPIELPPGDVNVNPFITQTLWWDTEFWNKRIKDAYVRADDWNADPTPFPKRPMNVDPRTGVIEVEGVPSSRLQPYLVVDARRSDLKPAGETVRSTSWGLDLIKAERPYRTPWAVLGLEPGDAVYVGSPVRLRLFEGAPARVTVSVMVPFQTTPEPVHRRVTLEGGGRRAQLKLASGEVGDLSLCLSRGKDAVLTLLPSPDTDESVRLTHTVVESRPTGSSC